MPRYQYRAKDRTLTLLEGTIDAESETAAVKQLSSAGVFPLSMSEAAASLPETPVSAPGAVRVSARTLATVSRQFADLLSGGLSVFQALSVLARQTAHPGMRGVLAEVGEAVRQGQSLSAALATHPTIFSSFYLSLIRAGEAGGNLDAVLARLADAAEQESELKGRLMTALAYPMFVLLIGVGMAGFLLVYVIPRLAVVFAEQDQLLPLPTRILLAISAGVRQWWGVWLVGAVAGGWALRAFWRSPRGWQRIDRFAGRLPLVGPLIRHVRIARFSRNLGVMLGQGVPILHALEVAGLTVAQTELGHAVGRIRDGVREGETLAAAMETSGSFPVFVSNMTAVGEESGTLESALLKVATAYEREANQLLRVFTALLEPVLIVLVGLMVMGIVMAMLLPIFQLGMIAQ